MSLTRRSLGNNVRVILLPLILMFIIAFLSACGQSASSNTTTGSMGGSNAGASAGQPSQSALTGDVAIDGSSTVYPISAAVAEEFMDQYPAVNVTVAFSGTGGGFKKSTVGEIDISNASRPIKDEENEVAGQNSIEFIDLTVAIDGISIVINQNNDFVDYLTVEELGAMWESGSSVNLWSDIRSHWPAEPIKLYGPGADSGTNDYFVEAIIGDKGIRTDFQASEDDNILVTGVAHDKYALGFFGYAYYVENRDKLKSVPIDNGSGPISPTDETINNGSYSPLSRPVFIYVNRERYQSKPEVTAFVDFYIENASELAPQVGYIALPDALLSEQKQKLAVAN